MKSLREQLIQIFLAFVVMVLTIPTLFKHSLRRVAMKPLSRITFNPEVMGGKPCIRGMRVTVGAIVGLLASGHNE